MYRTPMNSLNNKEIYAIVQKEAAIYAKANVVRSFYKFYFLATFHTVTEAEDLMFYRIVHVLYRYLFRTA